MPLPAARARRPSFSRVNNALLPFEGATALKSVPPSTATAPWHGKEAALKGSCKPRLGDLLEIAGHEWNHSNPIPCHHILQRAGNRPTHKNVNALFGEPNRLFRQRPFPPVVYRVLPNNTARFHIRQTNLPGHIENRCDPLIPNCERRSQSIGPAFRFTCIAILVPGRGRWW
jgi:hypothetical protein